MNTKLTYPALALMASASLIYACSGTETNGENGTESTTTTAVGGASGTGVSNGGATGATNSSAEVGSIAVGTGGAGGSCVDLVVEAEVTLKPADIIFVIDNSGSMGEETAGVENNINTSFAQVVAASNIDYRIIMVTHHGSQSSLYVCVTPPLSGTTNCAGPPVNVPGQFYHYSVDVQSHDSFCKLLNTFYGNEPDAYNLAPGGWNQWLRPEAVKVFVVMSDDGANCSWNGTSFNDFDTVAGGQTSAIAFDDELLALSPLQFGSKAKRNYLWYSIIGMGPKNPSMPLEPWNEFDDVTITQCTPGAVDPGTGYQWLSKGTGALRFPLCDPNGYSVVFNDIALGVEEGTQVSCELALPEPPMGQELDLNTLAVVYTPNGNGTPQELTKVDSPSQCGPANFYVENDLIHVCPQSCTLIESDNNASLQIKIACGGGID